jgi:hypothetical protein
MLVLVFGHNTASGEVGEVYCGVVFAAAQSSPVDGGMFWFLVVEDNDLEGRGIRQLLRLFGLLGRLCGPYLHKNAFCEHVQEQDLIP